MKKIWCFIIVGMALVSCTPNEFGTPFQKGQEVNLIATLGEQHPQLLPNMQRVSGKDTDPTNPNSGEIALRWDEDDKILVKVGEKSSSFSLTDGAGTGHATFTGIMPADGSRFSVQYPITTPNLTTQQYVQDGFGKELMLMTTKEEGTIDGGFVLSADYALLGLQLTGIEEIGKIVLSKNVSEGSKEESYTLLCPGVRLSASPTLFYIVVHPGEWANGFTVEVFASDEITKLYTFIKTSGITFGTDRATIMSEKHVPSILTIQVGDLSFNMIYVEGGTFKMGADKAETNPKLAATPAHNVTLSNYYIGETVITQPLWTAIMETTIKDELAKGKGDYLGEGDDYPMYAISWYDSQAFATKLSEVTGKTFRLPTEAEWEYAARGGKYTMGYKYAGSNTLNEVAWHSGNSKKDGKYMISPVKQKRPNELGLYDMTGNIWEWCQDRDYAYTSEAQTNPVYERTGTQLAIQRGGSTYPWGEASYRVYYRFPSPASTKITRCGLRLVLECE
jgi:formylglycine-generating enzyme required for sulfatase activity